jgi:hypothetical protein
MLDTQPENTEDFVLIPVIKTEQQETENIRTIDDLFNRIKLVAQARFKHRAIHIDPNNKIRNFFQNRLSEGISSHSAVVLSTQKTIKIPKILAYCNGFENFSLRLAPGDMLQRIPDAINSGLLDKRTNVKIVIYLKKVSERDHYKLVLQHTPEHFSVSLVVTSGNCEFAKGDGLLLLNNLQQ